MSVVVYAETNFLLELAYVQEQHASCEQLLAMAEAGHLRIVLPAFSFVEARAAIRSRLDQRRRAWDTVYPPLIEMKRSAPYQFSGEAVVRMLDLLLVESTKEELKRLEDLLSRLPAVTELIPMDSAILGMVPDLQQRLAFSFQDAVVCASVIHHLDHTRPAVSCFLNRNAKDFANSNVTQALRQRGCRLITRFDQGLGYVLSLE